MAGPTESETCRELILPGVARRWMGQSPVEWWEIEGVMLDVATAGCRRDAESVTPSCRGRWGSHREWWFVPGTPAGGVVAEPPEPFVSGLGCDPERGGDLRPRRTPVHRTSDRCFLFGDSDTDLSGRVDGSGQRCVLVAGGPIHDNQPALTGTG